MPTVKDIIANVSNTKIGGAFLGHVWRFDDRLQKFLRFADRHRSARTTEDFYRRVRSKFQDQQVRRGPFEGLKYGAEGSMGSSLIPKLLGSYENELHRWLETVPDKAYSTVVDIGCAEGYYAVGLAKMLPDAQVLAYDTNAMARESCKRLAALNGVENRITLGAFCDSETLRSLDLSKGGLIISDCEGYEAILFDSETVAHLARVDLVIECHDLIGMPITRDLREKFSRTHEVTVIETIPDHCKALDLDLPELAGEPFPVRLYMVEERRQAPQNFLILEARKPASVQQSVPGKRTVEKHRYPEPSNA